MLDRYSKRTGRYHPGLIDQDGPAMREEASTDNAHTLYIL